MLNVSSPGGLKIAEHLDEEMIVGRGLVGLLAFKN